MTEKLAPFALAIARFDVVVGVLWDESGDIKKVVPIVPGLMNSIAKVMALTPLPFVPAGPADPVHRWHLQGQLRQQVLGG